MFVYFFNADLHQKLLVLNLQRKSETVDDAAQNFEQFTDTIEMFRFVHEPDN